MAKRGKPKKPYRTYHMTHSAHEAKLAQVRAVYTEYIPLLKQTFSWQYRRVLAGDGVWNRADPKHLVTLLSERYKRSAMNQACESLTSWTGLAELEVKRILLHSSLPEDRLRHLLYANSRHEWYRKTEFTFPATRYDEKAQTWVKIPNTTETVTLEELKFLRRIVKHVKRTKVSLPDVSQTRTMKLDGIVAQWEEPKQPGKFTYWLRFSTLTKNKPVCIPLTSYRHAEDKHGEWSNTAQVRVERNGDVRFSLCKDITPEVKPVPAGGELGLDFGMNTLFATSRGDQYGQRYYAWLVERDKELLELTRMLQRNGIKPSESVRYQALQHRICEYSKNEVNRVLNRIVRTHGPKAIVVEELDFRGGGLSKKLNRLLQRIGLAQVYKKLDMLAQETGAEIVRVQPAYSSQGCSGCDYVDDRNRKGTRFSCRFCGKKRDAGTNASENVQSRRSWPTRTRYSTRVQVLALCDEKFTQRWGIDPAALRSTGRRQVRATSMLRPTADGLDPVQETVFSGAGQTDILVYSPA